MTDFRETLEKEISGSYTIERELGGAGMSRVFLATETRLDRRVVIKLLPENIASGISTERFLREIQLAAKLQHPHNIALGETDKALTLLEQAVQRHDIGLLTAASPLDDPTYAPVRSDPGFRRILDQMGLSRFQRR